MLNKALQQPTEYFAGLHLRRNDNFALVSEVLKGANRNHADGVAALLIVVLRLRNNLFHGVKWAYGIRGQLATSLMQTRRSWLL